jgi:uncharacterized protein involved in outer membrane biogenesis
VALVLASLGCLLLAGLFPLLLAPRAPEEPFTGVSVMATPRDLYQIAVPVRLSSAPDLVLTRGVLYADGNVAIGTPISKMVLDGPVFTLNAAGLRAAASNGTKDTEATEIAPLVEQLVAMGFETLTIRRGTVLVVAGDGTAETMGDFQAEITGRRKGPVVARGSFTLRGQRLSFDATLTPAGEKTAPSRWPLKFSLKSNLIEASFEGRVDVGEDLQLFGQAELTAPNVRRVARWFGIPLPVAEALKDGAVKGTFTWARRVLAFENGKVLLDGNEGAGGLRLSLAGDRPAIDGTLDFASLDLTPYLAAARLQPSLFDRQPPSRFAYDVTFPIVRQIDADLRISAARVAANGYALGRGAATLTVRSGRLLVDVSELQTNNGRVSAQITANLNERLPRYVVKGKAENFEVGGAAAELFGLSVLSGRSTISFDLSGAGQTLVEVFNRLSGKTVLTMAEGAKVALDLKALRALVKGQETFGWGAIAKGQTSLAQVEARALILDGVLVTDSVQARFGTSELAASGRVDLAERNLDLRLLLKETGSRPGADEVSVRGSWHEPMLRAELGPTEAGYR